MMGPNDPTDGATDRPNPDVFVEMPNGGEMGLLEFSNLLGGLGMIASAAAQARNAEILESAAEFQNDLLVANPEATILMDEAYGDMIQAVNEDGQPAGVIELLEAADEVNLDNYDVQAIRDRIADQNPDRGHGIH